MASKQESKDCGEILSFLKTRGYFRKTNDVSQIGLPDILGTFEGHFFGIEVKSIDEVPEDGMVPKKGKHAFTPTQVKEMLEIDKNGGTAIGFVVCGNQLLWITPYQIEEDGRVWWRTDQVVAKKRSGGWSDLDKLLIKCKNID